MGERGKSVFVTLGYNHHGKPTWLRDSWTASVNEDRTSKEPEAGTAAGDSLRGSRIPGLIFPTIW